jgi:hypothetical protein
MVSSRSYWTPREVTIAAGTGFKANGLTPDRYERLAKQVESALAGRALGTPELRDALLSQRDYMNSLARDRSTDRAAAYSPAIPVTNWPAGTCPRIDLCHRAERVDPAVGLGDPVPAGGRPAASPAALTPAASFPVSDPYHGVI